MPRTFSPRGTLTKIILGATPKRELAILLRTVSEIALANASRKLAARESVSQKVGFPKLCERAGAQQEALTTRIAFPCSRAKASRDSLVFLSRFAALSEQLPESSRAAFQNKSSTPSTGSTSSKITVQHTSSAPSALSSAPSALWQLIPRSCSKRLQKARRRSTVRV